MMQSRPQSRDDLEVPRNGRTAVDWLRIVRDGVAALVVFVGLGTAAGVAATLLQSTEYAATARAVVSPAHGFLDPQAADKLPDLTNTVAQLAGTETVLQETRRRFIALAGNPMERARRERIARSSWLNAHLTIGEVAHTSVLNVHASAPSQDVATNLAQAATRSLAEVVNSGTAKSLGVRANPNGALPQGALNAGLIVHVFPASGDGKTSPTPQRNLLVGVNLGIIAGLLAALGLGSFRERRWRPEEIARDLDVPLLGVLTLSRRGRLKRGAAAWDIRTQLRSLPAHEEGATLLALTGRVPERELAAAVTAFTVLLEKHGLSSVVVDANRKRTTTRLLRLGDLPGLTDVDEDSPLPLTRTTWEGGSTTVCVLPAGSNAAREETADLSQRLEILRRQLGNFEYVVVAGPSFDQSRELSNLLGATDGVVVVVARGTGRRELARLRDFPSPAYRRLAGVLVII